MQSLRAKFFVDDGFLKFISTAMDNWFIRNVDIEKMNLVQEYVNDNPKYKSLYTKQIDVFNTVRYLINNLVIERATKNFSLIKLDDQSTLYGLNMKAIDIMKLVNYGNMELKPYPIFTKMFLVFNRDMKYFQFQYEQRL